MNTQEIANLNSNQQIVTARGTITAGTSAVSLPIAPPFLPEAPTSVPVVASISQAAFDVTLNRVTAVLNSTATSVTVTGNANATADTVVAVFIDFRR